MTIKTALEEHEVLSFFVHYNQEDLQSIGSDTDTTSSGSASADFWDQEASLTSDDAWDAYWDYQYEPDDAARGSDTPSLLADIPQTPANTPETTSFPPITGQTGPLAVPVEDEDDEEPLSFFERSIRNDVSRPPAQDDSGVTHTVANLLERILIWLEEMARAYLAHSDESTFGILRALCVLLIASCAMIRRALAHHLASS